MGDGITRQEAKRMISSAIANYDQTSKVRHESQMQHLREVYGNGSGHKGFLERAHEQNTAVLGEQSAILTEVKEYVDGEKRKAETERLLETARVTAQASRDKKLNRLVNYSRIALPLLAMLLGKSWLLDLWHLITQHVH